ncbi:MAG: hypothetical protein BJ554DRAFT_4079 [Olpidium bornovanus]|uniref:Uncharacterized protein n=1 Tax=Olpidium bornovanus TaxID=278681 RepID=A0A8H8DFS0_9FUNG|nr:MAG: hypothetical protein BJ554DRAFT_4079 [Olpidium bornovanus]
MALRGRLVADRPAPQQTLAVDGAAGPRFRPERSLVPQLDRRSDRHAFAVAVRSLPQHRPFHSPTARGARVHRPRLHRRIREPRPGMAADNSRREWAADRNGSVHSMASDCEGLREADVGSRGGPVDFSERRWRYGVGDGGDRGQTPRVVPPNDVLRPDVPSLSGVSGRLHGQAVDVDELCHREGPGRQEQRRAPRCGVENPEGLHRGGVAPLPGSVGRVHA